MLLSEDFVFLHNPKTGGSFVTAALKNVYAAQYGRPVAETEKHGRIDDIPEEYRNKPVVTIIRNPLDFYASHYTFGYWIERSAEAPWDEAEMSARFASYPYLSFREFMDALFELGRFLPPSHRELEDSLGMGPLTLSALAFSVKDYLGILEKFARTDDINPLKRAIAQTRFLRTEFLNEDTYRWLIELGVPHEVAAPVLSTPKVQPLNTPNGILLERGHGQPRARHWSELFDPYTTGLVAEHDWLFFELFPEYSVYIPAAQESSRRLPAGNRR